MSGSYDSRLRTVTGSKLQLVGALDEAQGIEMQRVDLLRGLNVVQHNPRCDGGAWMSGEPESLERLDSEFAFNQRHGVVACPNPIIDAVRAAVLSPLRSISTANSGGAETGRSNSLGWALSSSSRAVDEPRDR